MDTDDDSVESWIEAGQSLDSQCEKLESEVSELRQVVSTMNDLCRDMANYIQSDEFKDKLLS